MSHDEGDDGPSRAGAIVVILFTVGLIVLGIWIAQALISGVRQQNCLMSGRRDCVQVPAAP